MKTEIPMFEILKDAFKAEIEATGLPAPIKEEFCAAVESGADEMLRAVRLAQWTDQKAGTKSARTKPQPPRRRPRAKTPEEIMADADKDKEEPAASGVELPGV